MSLPPLKGPETLVTLGPFNIFDIFHGSTNIVVHVQQEVQCMTFKVQQMSIDIICRISCNLSEQLWSREEVSHYLDNIFNIYILINAERFLTHYLGGRCRSRDGAQGACVLAHMYSGMYHSKHPIWGEGAAHFLKSWSRSERGHTRQGLLYAPMFYLQPQPVRSFLEFRN